MLQLIERTIRKTIAYKVIKPTQLRLSYFTRVEGSLNNRKLKIMKTKYLRKKKNLTKLITKPLNIDANKFKSNLQ